MMVGLVRSRSFESDLLRITICFNSTKNQAVMRVFIEKIAKEVGKEKMEYVVFKADDDVDKTVRAYATNKVIEA